MAQDPAQRRRIPRRLLAAGSCAVVAALVYVAVIAQGTPPPRDRGDVSMLENGETRTIVTAGMALTSSLRTFDQSVWVGPEDRGRVVDATNLTCHGGLAHVIWHIGNLEPGVANTGIHLTAQLDGKPVGSILRGTPVEVWGDQPAELHAVIDCPTGEHDLGLLIRSIHGRWGFPSVTDPDPSTSPVPHVPRGFVVTEVWD